MTSTQPLSTQNKRLSSGSDFMKTNTKYTDKVLQSRKTSSVDTRQRSETLNMTQAQADSVYKKIKIKQSQSRKTLAEAGGGFLCK